jgi:hypothetical protein
LTPLDWSPLLVMRAYSDDLPNTSSRLVATMVAIFWLLSVVACSASFFSFWMRVKCKAHR